MIKKQPTTNSQGPLKAKPAEVVSQAATTKGSPKKTPPFTDGIEFLAVGRQQEGRQVSLGREG